MAKQTVNIGTSVNDGSGDPARTAFNKLNQNNNEIYTYLGDGTNLNKLGTAAFKNVGTSTGNVMEVGAFGLGINQTSTPPVATHEYLANGFYGANALEGFPYGYGEMIVLNQTRWIHRLFFPALLDCCPSISSSINGSDWTSFSTFLVLGRNTVTDGNGFVKAASPVINLFADKIEANDEAQRQNIKFEKLGTGDYLIKNSSGLSNDGWYIEQPKDANGNIFHAVEYGTHDNGDIWVKTYEQMMDGTRIAADHTKPIDIKENRFISIRLNALPTDTTVPINPTVKDNEGNAAPSRLHELVDGVWVISDENAAMLEQERLAAMKPLTRRQFRLALALNGYDLAEIKGLINQIDDPMQRQIALIEWQDATTFERNNPTLIEMAGLLELSSSQVDELWKQAITL